MPAQFILGQAALSRLGTARDQGGRWQHQLQHVFRHQGRQRLARQFGCRDDTEYVGGVARKSTEKFRAYGSPAESFADYARLIGNNPRYAATLKSANARDFAQACRMPGYATDPAYARKLTAAIQMTPAAA